MDRGWTSLPGARDANTRIPSVPPSSIRLVVLQQMLNFNPLEMINPLRRRTCTICYREVMKKF
jgi:hypothetical protein